MSIIQSGILLEHCKAAIFLEASIIEYAGFGQKCRDFLASLSSLQSKYPDAHLGAVIAFGHDSYSKLTNGKYGGKELKNFYKLGKSPIIAPSTQKDLLIHIQSMRPDVNFSMAQSALSVFNSKTVSLKIEEETHGFRWVDERDLTGFIDGTENPKGPKRESVAIIPNGLEDQGGSYVMSQRYEHRLEEWNKQTVNEQEKTMGRTKQDSEELDPSVRYHESHVSKTDIGLKIVRQSLPYGLASGKHGLYFIAYAAHLNNIERQLLNMFGELDGKTDKLLNYTSPVTGSYFFAPSITTLNNL